MSNTTGNTNSCSVTTIFPLGVVCFTENATSQTANDGTMTIFITGGTPPYSVTWSNGEIGVTQLTNVPPGTYIAYVTDYYGDYQESTGCVVGYDIVSQTPTPTPSITPTYTPTPTLTVTQTPSRTPGGTPQPTPTHTVTPSITSTLTQTPSLTPSSNPIPQTMCLELNQSPYSTLEFSYDGNYNGFPQWTASTDSSIVMSFSLINFRWEVSNYPTVGSVNIVNTSQVLVPLGSWSQLGSSNTWTLVSGSCPVQPLNISLITTDETCQYSADGTLMVTANSGTAPYTYQVNSLPQVVTSVNPYTFTGLNGGLNTFSATDSNSQTFSQNFTIGTGNQITTYYVTFTSTVTNNGVQTQYSKNQTVNYSMNVVPALPAGASLTFDLNISRNYTQQTATLYGASQVATFTGNPSFSVSSSGTINSTSTSDNAYTTPGSICDANGLFSGETKVLTGNITIVQGTTVGGSVQNIISVPAPINASCPVFCSAETTISVSNLVLSNVPCSTMSQENNPAIQVISVGTNQIA